MGAVLLLARSEVRHRWRALVVLGVLAGLVSGVVLGALLGARRTATAFDRLIDRTAYWDAEAQDVPPELLDDVAALPMVDASWVQSYDVGLVTNREQVLFLAIQAGGPRPPVHYEPLVVEGRMWDPSALDELVISERAAAQLGFGIGSTLDFAGASPAQYAGFEQGIVPEEPEGGRATFEVVGIVRDPLDSLPFGVARLLATSAYSRSLGPSTGGPDLVTVRLARGAADVASFRTAVAELVAASRDASGDPEGVGPGIEVVSVHEQREVVDRATSVAVQALLAFAATAAVAGLVAVGQALSRNLLAPASDAAAWAAMGMTARARRLALVLPRVIVSVVGATIAVAVAVLASPLTPVGVGRTVEPAPGVETPLGYLILGSLAVAVTLGALVVTAAVVAMRRRPPEGAGSASTVLARTAAAGGSLPLVVGTRFALDPGRGRSTVPTRSAVAGAVLGVTGLVAAGAVLTSLERLVSSPNRYGWGHDVTVVDVDEELLEALAVDEQHGSVVAVRRVNLRLEDQEVLVSGLEAVTGRLALPVQSGRLPVGPGEVALGPALAGRLDVGVGDRVEAPAIGGGTTSLAVVGTVLTDDIEDFAGGAVLTADGLEALATGDDGYRSAWVTWADGVDEDTATAALAADKEIGLPELPADVGNLGQVEAVVRGLACFLAALALAATGHAVFVTARRRRRELGVLRAIGATGHQLAGAIRWMAVVQLAIGLAVGVPLGLAAAGFVWRRIAEGVGVAGDLAVPGAALGTAVPLTIAAAMVIAAAPAHRAAQLGAADALRAE